MITPIYLAIASVLGTLGHSGWPGGPVSFRRIYTVGEKAVYASEMDANFLANGPGTMDMTVTTKKLLDNGHASLLFHLANLKDHSDKKQETPPDITLDTTKNNMPEQFGPKMADTEMLAAMFLIAGATADKWVKVGVKTPVKWVADKVVFKGSVRILSVSSNKKQMKTLVKADMMSDEGKMGEVTFNSVDDLATCRLISSTGQFKVGHAETTFRFIAQ